MKEGVLQGWKSIALFLDRDERTVRRWEKQHGLPIRRLTNDRKSVVYAIPSELEQWLLEPRGAQANSRTSPESPSPQNDSPDPITAREDDHAPAAGRTAQPRWTATRRLLVVQTVLLATVCCFAAALQYRARSAARQLARQHQPAPSSAAPDESVLEGELLLDRRTPASMNRAVEILTYRTRQSPADASAFASLAKALCLLREYSTTPSSAAYPPAEDAARRALALDPENADAHSALGFIDFFWKWDAASAEQHFARAITLAPASATAHQWYGSMLLHQGRKDEALKQLNQAQHLAPSSIAIMSTRAMALSLSGQRSAAEEILKKLEEDAPEALPPYRTAAYLSLQAPVDIPAFLDQTGRFNQYRGDISGVAEVSHARRIYQLQGKESMLRFLLAQERLRSQGQPHPSFRAARLEALLGQDDAASLHVLQAVQDHDEGAIALSIDPAFETLRRQGKLDQALKLLPATGVIQTFRNEHHSPF